MNNENIQIPNGVSEDKRQKLELSWEESAGLSLRDIRCPYCNFLVDQVFSDITGHKLEYCRKCKSKYPINLGYFRTIKRWIPYEGFHNPRQRR